MVAPLLLAAAVLAAQPAPQARRFALVVGANEGLPGDEKLRFAEADARRMGQVLMEVGAVAPADERILLGAKASELRSALDQLQARLRQEARPTDQLVVYVSSHADEGDLRLMGTRFPLRELYGFISEAPVGVAVLIVDSCRSGTLTRLKGLKPVSGTSVSIEAPELNGRVVISSSGPDEYSQESDRLGGSHFTHHLEAALRGAGDSSRDGRVTLQEAYAYAYARTVETTFGSRGGIQHPGYRFDLKGRGELVLSEPSRGRSHLTIDVEHPGQWLVLSEEGRSVVGEFVKGTGPAVFAVPPGTYRVRYRLHEGYREAVSYAAYGGNALVKEADLGPLVRERGFSKGSGEGVRLGLGASLGSAVPAGMAPMIGGELSAEVQPERPVGPISLFTAVLGFRRGHALGEIPFRHVELQLSAGASATMHAGGLRWDAGLLLGATLIRQDQIPGRSLVWGLEPHLLGAAGVRLPVSDVLSVRAGVMAGPALVKTLQATSVRWFGQGSLGVAFEL